MELINILTSDAEVIIKEATDKLNDARLKNYQKVDRPVLHSCLTRLFELTVESIKNSNLLALNEYIDKISRERYFSGFELYEVQTAFNALEEAIWNDIVSKVNQNDLVDSISIISRVMGAGKEFLACNYVRMAKLNKKHTPDVTVLRKGI